MSDFSVQVVDEITLRGIKMWQGQQPKGDTNNCHVSATLKLLWNLLSGGDVLLVGREPGGERLRRRPRPLNEVEMVAKGAGGGAPEKVACFFRAGRIVRSLERESNVVVVPRLKGHLKNGRY